MSHNDEEEDFLFDEGFMIDPRYLYAGAGALLLIVAMCLVLFAL